MTWRHYTLATMKMFQKVTAPVTHQVRSRIMDYSNILDFDTMMNMNAI